MVILAAGTSSRMGRPKLLLEWAGKTLVRRAAETALDSGATQVILVSGPRDTEMRAELADLPVMVVHNPDYAEGMSTSLRAGLSAVSPDAEGAIIMLSDQPLLSSSVVCRLAATLRGSDALIVQPRYGGAPGNPVGFHRSLFDALRSQSGDQGARALLRRRQADIDYIDIDDAEMQQDIDTPEDFASLNQAADRPNR
ncbi:MAG: NTP transferase domain-containing protein [Chloroflexota bacterium]